MIVENGIAMSKTNTNKHLNPLSILTKLKRMSSDYGGVLSFTTTEAAWFLPPKSAGLIHKEIARELDEKGLAWVYHSENENAPCFTLDFN